MVERSEMELNSNGDEGVRRANLTVLAGFLERAVPPPEFSMYNYISIRGNSDRLRLPANCTPEVYVCGTVACAAGHGPLAGIEALPHETWSEYTQRAFSGPDPNVFFYLFAADWTDIDDTPKGAAARIRRYLAEGTPDLYSAASVQNRGRSYSLSDFICDASYSGSVMGDAMRQFLLDTYAEYLVIDADV